MSLRSGTASSRRTPRGPQAVERASAGDRAFLAMDTGPVPEQFGVVLLLEKSELDLGRIREVLGERIPAVPRLRQRLTSTPLGCGGPIWVDDLEFDIRAHVHEVACRAPGDEDALLATALSEVMTPLPRTAPLWAATFVTGAPDGRTALVLVLHHVLSDGIGGLAVLANLVDPGPEVVSRHFPRRPPTANSLVLDAWEARLAAVGRIARWSRLLRTSMAAGGGLRPPRAADCSLIQRTGPRRQLAVVRADHRRLRAAAHRHGATTNDAVLVAVAGALHRVLLDRGESADHLVITVPVAGRRAASGPDLGNMVTPIIVAVPTTGGVPARLADVAAQVRAAKQRASVPPPIALLGWLFRPLAALGGFHWYMNHQHRFHTLVSHLRGPAEPLAFAGAVVSSAVPVVVAEGGNATAYFGVLSYAGTLTISAMVDPDHFPDLATLTDGLRAELGLLVGAGQE